MTDPRPYSKKELKQLFTNLNRKGITDDMMERLIETLWRNKFTMRTSGFANTGGPDAVIAFDNATRKFSITPLDPEVETYVPRFAFYTYNYSAEYHQRLNPEEIEIPNEEGLYCIYYDTEESDRVHKLFYVKNPGELKLKDLYYTKVIVSFVYWDYDAQEALHFGDDRHGSELNPQLHWIIQSSGFAKRFMDGGLTLTDYVINGDGSSNSHVNWKVSTGKFWHGDFLIDIPVAGELTNIPVLSWSAGLPRLSNSALPVVYTSRLNFNPDGDSITAAASGKYVMYHAFATNDRLAGHHVISVMGRNQYETLADAYAGLDAELLTLFSQMPQSGKCYLATLFYEVDDTYTNAMKARLVSIAESTIFVETQGKNHSPVTIANDSKNYLSISNKQVLSLIVANLPGGSGTDGREVELSTSGGYIVWRYVSDIDWNNLVALATLVGPPGAPGADGDDGREVELRENAGWVEWRYTGDVVWTQLFEIPAGGSGGGVIQATGTLLAANWVADGSLNKYVLSNVNITATSTVEVIPANAAYDVLVVAEPMPETVSASGSVTVWAKNIPTTDIPVTINITETV